MERRDEFVRLAFQGIKLSDTDYLDCILLGHQSPVGWYRFKTEIEIKGLLGRLIAMDDRAHRLNHGLRSVALEDVAAHVDPRRSFVHRLPGHLQGFELWQLLSP